MIDRCKKCNAWNHDRRTECRKCFRRLWRLSPSGATHCSAPIEVEYYVSPCGKFHGCSEDYTEDEWDEIVAGDSVVVFAGTTVDSARSQLMDAGLQESEVDELIPLPNVQDHTTPTAPKP